MPETFVVDNGIDENDGNFSKGDLSLREAIELHVAGLREDGIDVPKPTSLVRYLEVVS